MAKKKKYHIYFKVILETSFDISADSYENAIEKAREFKVRDLVDFDTDYNTGSVSVIGVYNDKEEPKEV